MINDMEGLPRKLIQNKGKGYTSVGKEKAGVIEICMIQPV